MERKYKDTGMRQKYKQLERERDRKDMEKDKKTEGGKVLRHKDYVGVQMDGQ